MNSAATINKTTPDITSFVITSKPLVQASAKNIKANKTGQYSSLVYIFEKSNDINV